MDEEEFFSGYSPQVELDDMLMRRAQTLPTLGQVVYLDETGAQRRPTNVERLTADVFRNHEQILQRYYMVSQNPNYEELFPIDLSRMRHIKRFFDIQENGDRAVRQLTFSDCMVDYAFSLTNDTLASDAQGNLQRLAFGKVGEGYDYVDQGFNKLAKAALLKNLGQLVVSTRHKR